MRSATFFTISPFSRGEIIGENGRLFCLCDAKSGEHCICGVQLDKGLHTFVINPLHTNLYRDTDLRGGHRA